MLDTSEPIEWPVMFGKPVTAEQLEKLGFQFVY